VSSNRYPTRQPFPRNPAVSITPELASEPDAKSSLPTYPFPPYDAAEYELQSYIDIADSSNITGATIGIKGPSGSGKTHLIYYLMQIVRAKMSRAIRIYVKSESSDFLDLYRRAIDFLGPEPLKHAHTALLGGLGHREILSKGLQPAEVGAPLAEQLRADPAAVYGFIESRILSELSLFTATNTALQGTRSHFNEFVRAYSYLLHETLSEYAFDWISGKVLAQPVLQQLGVRRNIVDSEMAIMGIRFLITILREVRQPFFIFFDQIERLVLDAEPSICASNRGRFHGLVAMVNDIGRIPMPSGDDQGVGDISR
jgi:hypothetical protein